MGRETSSAFPEVVVVARREETGNTVLLVVVTVAPGGARKGGRRRNSIQFVATAVVTRKEGESGRTVVDTCYDRGCTFVLKWFLNDGVP